MNFENEKKKRILVTGSAGFIGSNLVKYLLEHTNAQIVGLDAHTYAARPDYLEHYLTQRPEFQPRYHETVFDITQTHWPVTLDHFDEVYHLAAESHVCRSIETPEKFVHANIIGSMRLLEEIRKSKKPPRTIMISTDEVFGELCLSDPPFNEKTPLAPRSPYAASKAAADLLTRAYFETYGLPVMVTNCSNNFGPNQHEEKLIPKTILSVLKGKPITLYGPGTQIRDWLWVEDHCSALFTVMQHGKLGERYCIGGKDEMSNTQVVHSIVTLMRPLWPGGERPVIVHTDDRPTDDFRYAIDTARIEKLGWIPRPEMFRENLVRTIRWYAESLVPSDRLEQFLDYANDTTI
jgi:dTDP-glucose 4,6-dehydratase